MGPGRPAEVFSAIDKRYASIQFIIFKAFTIGLPGLGVAVVMQRLHNDATAGVPDSGGASPGTC